MAKKPAKGGKTAAPVLSDVSRNALAYFVAPDSMPYLQADAYTELVAAGLVEVNTQLADANGAHASRLTPAGVEFMASTAGQPAAEAAPAAVKPVFELDDNVPLPATVRRGRSESIYPFETMGVNQSFHIAATAEKENPAREYASTISSATRRLEPKRFVIRAVDASDPRGVGARVYRLPDYTPHELAQLEIKRNERARSRAASSAAAE